MKRQNQSHRKARTRTLIQLGGLMQKSGLMDAFLIEEGDDLQDYKNLVKSAQLLGFLSESFEKRARTRKMEFFWLKAFKIQLT